MSATTDDVTPVAQGVTSRPETIAKPLGFIGLGTMGLPMAVNCARQGIAVLGCDADPTRLAMLVDDAGPDALVHTTPVVSEVAARCEIVVLMLPTSKQVDEVVSELAESLPSGALLIDMGSSVPSETCRLAAALEPRGITLIDAPVSGAVERARFGRLTILLGGTDAGMEKARIYLEAMGERIIRTGPVGSAHAMKALNNFVYAAGLLAVLEAVGVAAAAGLDLEVFADVLNASSGRNVASEAKLKQFILSGSYEGGFRLGLMAKDLQIAANLAEESRVETPALATCLHVWRRALDALGPDADNTEMHRLFSR
ncbi:MAG: NAD(P)-dependent oxidoreductase [Acetobacteraceae bacterium]|nr:NAD(P)-dependent oxidoreductase [Acetobacteraceae bacterium]